MRRRRSSCLAALVLVGLVAPAVRAAASDAEALAERHGWRYLVDKLAADGVPRAEAAAVFADPRMPAFDGLPFALEPRESHARYRDLRSGASVRAARSCRARYADAFDKAAAREGVPASLVATIVHVESACGRNTVIHDGVERKVPAKTRLQWTAGDRLRIETPGGGGYGAP